MLLVTGATGLLGNNIVRLLLAQGERVRVLARDPQPSRSLADLPVEFARGDVRDPAAIHAALQGTRGVIHSAGHVHIGWGQHDLHRAINVEGTQHVARAACDLHLRMVYVSSVNALGTGSPSQPVGEEDSLPNVVPCPYVTTKREAEQRVLTMVAKEGLDAVVVNPGFMLGPWDWKPSSGRMLLEIGRRFTPVAPTGGCSVCDVRDVGGGVIAALNQGKAGRRYILAGHNVTYFELWRKMGALGGSSGPWLPLGPFNRWCGGQLGDLFHRVTGREPDLNSAAMRMASQFHYFRSDRAIDELGYTIRPLDESLNDAWEWFKKYKYI